MADRTVIVSMVGQALASSPGSVFDLFIESFHVGHGTKHLLNHLLIIALDSKVFRYCKSMHPHCFYLTSKKPSLLPHLKYKFLQELIELGYNFIFTDADVMWLRNPVSQIHPTKALTIACDFNSSDLPSVSDKVDQGFFAMPSNELTVELFKYWDMARFLHPNKHDRSLCEATVSEDIFKALWVEVEYLDAAHFGGFCQQSIHMEEIYTVRANCCENIENKVYDLRMLLDDWRNFTGLSA
ncbi:hypothetical protein Dsin_031080 [Dipteronia sinensis]|uniref:Nucleotide-diphospho-sugar transferase domain-containing protein n=1 Tax=Dipteronia sinensis TaxID=43782 RepID=A0AAD9ZM81_9ROSI|nr:hypothetical protein Dsin_031080 [Dipteronia sinensis]